MSIRLLHVLPAILCVLVRLCTCRTSQPDLCMISQAAPASPANAPSTPRHAPQAGAIGDILEEDMGAVLSFQDFQGGRAGLAHYLLWRTQAASWAERGLLPRGIRLSLR